MLCCSSTSSGSHCCHHQWLWLLLLIMFICQYQGRQWTVRGVQYGKGDGGEDKDDYKGPTLSCSSSSWPMLCCQSSCLLLLPLLHGVSTDMAGSIYNKAVVKSLDVHSSISFADESTLAGSSSSRCISCCCWFDCCTTMG